MTEATTTTASTDWYAPLRERQSLGLITPKASHQGELAARRAEHLSQFFTPCDLAAFMWRCAAPAMAALIKTEGELVSLFDNSIGSGRLFHLATPEHHTIAGLDIHADSINALSEALAAAGFKQDLLAAGMEEVRPHGFDVALINPPFSIALSSPILQPLPPTTAGRFGPNTSAVSHEYALAQALSAAQIVVALMPRSWVDRMAQSAKWATRPLAHVFHAPPGSFREEGTDVDVSILVYGESYATPRKAYGVTVLADLDDSIPDLGLKIESRWRNGPSALRRVRVDANKPSITLPVTGDTTVRIFRHRQTLRLEYACGLTQARVANALLRENVAIDGADRHRYPKGMRFVGEGQLDLEVHAMQEDAAASLQRTLDVILTAGGSPAVDAGLRPYFRRLLRRRAVECTALSHTVYLPDASPHRGTELSAVLTAKARRKHVMDPSVWGSALAAQGSVWSFTRNDATERYTTTATNGKAYTLSRDELLDRFDVELPSATQQSSAGWHQITTGRLSAFPDHASNVHDRLSTAGANAYLTWDFQRTDVAEAAMTRGSVIAGCMGTGKTREGIALALMGGKHNLIVVEAHIMGEWTEELQNLGIPDGDWQVIDSPATARALRRVNLITYDRVRRPLYAAHARLTYARILRGRINTVVVDEAHCLANVESLQVRSLQHLNAKRRYLLTGTPIGNYPRDLLPLAQFVLGQGTAAQPYGKYRPYIEPRLVTSCSFAQRGGDAFREAFVRTEWTTHEFELSDMQQGAKREVPKLNNLTAFREFASRVVKRRVLDEPEVARHVRIPAPTREVVTVDWEPTHLAYYLDIADSFVVWWRDAKRHAESSGRSLNLVSLLAHISAVVTANNCPQKGVGRWAPFPGLTGKDDAVLQRLMAYAGEGRKTICYAHNPLSLELYRKHLDDAGIASTIVHGGLAVRARTERMHREFKHGSSPILLVSLGCGDTGLNLPQADAIVYNGRSWSQRIEDQADARALRPQQTRTVHITRFHHRGSIDEYQATMVAMKADAARAGLDWGTPEHEDTPWLHWAHILGQFVESIAELRGMTHTQMRKELKHVA